MTHIHTIATLTAPHKSTQKEFLEWAETAFEDQQDFRKFRFLVSRTGIQSRFSVIDDFTTTGKRELFSRNGQFFSPKTEDRLVVFQREAHRLSHRVAEKCLNSRTGDKKPITHLIAVSCTGMQAPGLEINLSNSLGLSDVPERYAINFMGCYAAFHGIKQAHYICSSLPEARVLLVCTECCTLHFRQSDKVDDLLSASLFGDGAAALLIGNEPASDGINMEWVSHTSRLINAPDEMGWKIGSHGFEMKLSQEVPVFIEKHIGQVYDELMREAKLKEVEYFAIHPGGKKVLEGFERAIGIDRKELEYSYRVLQQCGNMSSPTVLFVLEEVQKAFASGTKNEAMVFCAAFGPGLTIEAALIKLTKNE